MLWRLLLGISRSRGASRGSYNDLIFLYGMALGVRRVVNEGRTGISCETSAPVGEYSYNPLIVLDVFYRGHIPYGQITRSGSHICIVPIKKN